MASVNSVDSGCGVCVWGGGETLPDRHKCEDITSPPPHTHTHTHTHPVMAWWREALKGAEVDTIYRSTPRKWNRRRSRDRIKKNLH